MATQAQIDYIKSLISGLKIENVPYLSQQFDGSEYTDDEDRDFARRYFEKPRRDWMLDAIGVSTLKPIKYADAVTRYNARIAELEAMSFDDMTTQDASKTINLLKAKKLVW
jgi:hypothetical protein